MAKMKDIAALTGLNISTVSRALSGSSDISEKTRKIVLDTANEIGYQTKSMHRAAKKTIGLVVPELYSQYYSDLFHIIKKELRKKGYSIVVTISEYSANDALIAIRDMKALGVSGIILISGGFSNKELLSLIDSMTDMPKLLLSETSHNLPVDTIFIDQNYIVELIIQHIKEQNFQEIGYLGENLSTPRLKALYALCKQNGIIFHDNMIFSGAERFELGGYLRAKEMLKRGHLPDVVVACYDEIAIGAMHAFEEAGLHIPQDIAIIGVEDIQAAQYLHTPLTSVNTPVVQMCSIAVKLLLTQIESPDDHVVQHVSLQSKLVPRESTLRISQREK
jgi:LacI family transcriptional regulator